jgi:hypothetical protein
LAERGADVVIGERRAAEAAGLVVRLLDRLPGLALVTRGHAVGRPQTAFAPPPEERLDFAEEVRVEAGEAKPRGVSEGLDLGAGRQAAVALEEPFDDVGA